MLASQFTSTVDWHYTHKIIFLVKVNKQIFINGTILFKLIYLLINLFIFRERGKEGEKEGKKHQYVREALIG